MNPVFKRHKNFLLILGLAVLAFITLAFHQRLGRIHENIELSGESTNSDPQIQVSTTPSQKTVTSNQSTTTKIKTESTNNKPQGWETYDNTKYRFQLHYPKDKWHFDDTGAIADLPSSHTPLYVINLYTKGTNDEGITVISVGIYKKPALSSLEEWLFKGYEREGSPTITQIIADIPTGTIDTALEKAKRRVPLRFTQEGQEEPPIVTYTKFKEGKLDIYEIGAVLRSGLLQYTRYLTSNDLEYVYAIDISLAYDYADTSRYVEIYKKVVSAFKISL